MKTSVIWLQFSELKFIILYSIQEWRRKTGEMLFVFLCSVLSVLYSHHCVVNWFNGRQLECEFFLSVGYQIIIRTQVERKSAFCQGTWIVYYQDVIIMVAIKLSRSGHYTRQTELKINWFTKFSNPNHSTSESFVVWWPFGFLQSSLSAKNFV